MYEETVNLQNIYYSMEECVSNIIRAFDSERIEMEPKYITDQLINSKVENDVLNKQLNKLNVEYNNSKLTCESLLKTLNEKNNELQKYDVELGDLENEFNRCEKELEKIGQDLLKMKKTKLSTKDQEIFELSRKKFELYGQMTNIKWDYSVPISSDLSRGYIVNENKNYIKAFEFKTNQKGQKISEKLWEEIELGSGEDWSDIVAMTNVEKSG